jgi:L-ribulose-5-phosphate 4-epimerase
MEEGANMFDELKQRVLKANLLLPKHGLVTFTWGNVSEADRARGVMAIKPSGVAYEDMAAADIVVLDLANGDKVEGSLNPSSDAATHLALYRAFESVGGVVHTHSPWATVFAQAHAAIPALGTTHADYFWGNINCTRPLTAAEIGGDYEAETGNVIIEMFRDLGLCPNRMPAALAAGHAPFVWGKDAEVAVHNAVVLEQVAYMAWHTIQLNPASKPIPQNLLDKHFLRKHGPGAYYGQVRSKR